MFEFLFGVDGVQMALLPLLAVAAISAAVGVAGTAIANKKKRQELAKMKGELEGDMSENKSWYQANALSDYTGRSDVQNMFKHLRDNLKSRRKATTAAATVTGATPSAIAATKEADTKAISDVYSNVAAMGQQYKDNVTRQYFDRQNALRSQMQGLGYSAMQNHQQMADSYTNLAGTGINAAGGAYAEYLKAK
jgi:hypothetical protein